MIRLERRCQQIISCFAHGLASGPLEFEGMPTLDIVALLDTEILLRDRDAVEGSSELGIRLVLKPVQFDSQRGERVVGRIRNQETEINQIVRVGKLRHQLEILWQVIRRVTKRGEQEDPLSVLDRIRGRPDRVEVQVLDSSSIDLDGFVVVEGHRRLVVLVPCCVFVLGDLERGFCGSEAVEPAKGSDQLV